MDLSAFRSALAVLHDPYNRDKGIRADANEWLRKWQDKPETWAFADAVLREPSSSSEELFWCAQTLKVKVTRDFEELPASAVNDLRESLIHHLLRFNKSMPAVRTQLCLCLAALATTMPPEHWGAPPGAPSGGNPVRWYAERFNREPPEVAVPCVLEIMSLLPQEAGSSKIAVHPKQRAAALQDMKGCLGDAFAVLSTCVQKVGPSAKGQVLEAFASWLKFAGSALQALGPLLETHGLVQLALAELTESADTFDAAVNACVELIWATVDREGAVVPVLQGLAGALVQRVMDLVPRFALCRERAQAEAEGRDPDELGGGEDAAGLDDDEETVKSIARLFVEVAEAFNGMIAAGTPEVMRLVEAMLEVAAYPDYAICSMSFDFWYRLTKNILGVREGPASVENDEDMPATIEVISFRGGARTIAPDEMRRRIGIFTPVFERLTVSIMGRAAYPVDYNSLSRDDRVDFREGRQRITEVLNDAIQVLGFDRVLQLLLDPLQQMISAGRPFDWRVAEACLFCVRGISKSLSEGASSPVLLQLFSSLASLPTSDPRLFHTASLLVGAYAGWIVSQPGSLVTDMLGLLCTFIAMDDVSMGAGIAIQHMCGAGRGKLVPLLPELLQLYRRMMPAGAVRLLLPADQAAAVPSSIHEEDVACIIEGCASVMMSLDATEAATEALSAALTPLMQVLQQCLDEAVASGSVTGSAVPAGPVRIAFYACLERVCRLFKQFFGGDQAAAGAALQVLAPLLIRSLQQSAGDSDAAEKVGKAARYAIKCSKTFAAPSLSSLLEALTQAFSIYHYPSVLFVVSEVVKTFGKDAGAEAALTVAVTSLVATSARVLRTFKDIDNHPDLADDLFLLAMRCVTYAPRTVAAPVVLQELYAIASQGILVMHRDAQRSAVNLMVDLLRGPELTDEMKRTVAGCVAVNGPELVRRVLGGAIGFVPSQYVPGLGDTLDALLRFTGGAAGTWLLEAVDAMPPGVLSDDDRVSLRALIMGLAQSCTPKICIKVLDGISEVLRRNRRVQDAATAVLLPGLAPIPGPPPAYT